MHTIIRTYIDIVSFRYEFIIMCIIFAKVKAAAHTHTHTTPHAGINVVTVLARRIIRKDTCT